MGNKKVLLVDPTFNPGNIPPNLGLGGIEAKLAAHDVACAVADFVISDSRDLSLGNFQLLEQDFITEAATAAATADAVYISGSHGMEMKPYAMFPRIRALAAAAKQANPNVRVIFGGALANYYELVMKFGPEKFKRFGIDDLVSGQEINAATNILLYLGIEPTLLRLSASGTRRSDEFLPAWQAWNLAKYPDYLSAMIRVGCPFKCSFCFEGKVYEPNATQTMPVEIPRIVDRLRSRRNISSVMVEDSIAISLPWFGDLSEAMTKTNLSWAIYARSSEIVKHSAKVASLRQTGCRSVVIGIESFEDDLHAATKKQITTDQSLQALDMCAEAGVAVQGCMILAFPDDTAEKIQRRITLAQSHHLSTYRWHVLQPDWTKLPATIRGLSHMQPEDHFTVQVSIPDTCIPEYLESAPSMAIYDEHLLIRALPFYRDIPRLADFGYVGMPDFRELMEQMKPLILRAGLPTNEDEMYPMLFDPDRQPPVWFPDSGRSEERPGESSLS